MASRVEQVSAWLRKSGPGVGLEILVNAVLPVVIYDVWQKQLGDVGALLASSGPPIVWSIVQFVRSRRVDALSLFVLAGIALSLLAFFGGGGAKFLQLRENLVTGAIGALFLGSALIGKPLIYHLARASMMRSDSARAAEFEGLRDNVYFRRTMTVMTVVWGLGLVLRTAIACVLVFTLSIADYLVVGHIVGYAFAGALALWTFVYAGRQQRLGAARRAAAAAAESPAAAA
ncbi:MAG TPA: VC0807 family protein [Caulobacteraceae bacterium]|jgi:hypothetical protein|nr:VC0807 family protein [Caulobacteraceae bacterium]